MKEIRTTDQLFFLPILCFHQIHSRSRCVTRVDAGKNMGVVKNATLFADVLTKGEIVNATLDSGSFSSYPESEGYEFQLISMDRQWNFEAHSLEDRDDWVSHIDQAIITRLQLLESTSKREAVLTGSATGATASGHAGVEVPSNSWGGGSHSVPGVGGGGGGGSTGSDPGGVTKEGEKGENMRVDEAMAKSLRAVAGNDACADCGAPGEFSDPVFVEGEERNSS